MPLWPTFSCSRLFAQEAALSWTALDRARRVQESPLLPVANPGMMAAGRAGTTSRGETVEHVLLCEASDLVIARRRRRSPEGVSTRVWRGSRNETRGALRWTAWTGTDLFFVLLLLAIIVLNATDVIVTISHVLDVGWAAEGNPLARAAGTAAGPWALVLIKGIALAFSIPVMWYVYRLGAAALRGARATHERIAAQRTQLVMLGSTVMLTLFYTWVIQNNLRIVGVFRTALGMIGL